MTEYEVASLALDQASAIREQVTLRQTQAEILTGVATTFWSVLFAYIAVAYFAGTALTRLQVCILNFLYSLIVIWLVASYWGAHSAATYQYLELLELQPNRGMPFAWRAEVRYFGFALQALSTLASLWFMWTVRHPAEK